MLCVFLVKLQFTFWFTIKFSSNFSYYFILEIRLLLFNRCPLISRRQLLFYYFNEACIIIGKMNIRPNGSINPRGKHASLSGSWKSRVIHFTHWLYSIDPYSLFLFTFFFFFYYFLTVLTLQNDCPSQFLSPPWHVKTYLPSLGNTYLSEMVSNTANSAAAEAANLSNPKLRNTWIRLSLITQSELICMSWHPKKQG